jgi:hypothetical protein
MTPFKTIKFVRKARDKINKETKNKTWSETKSYFKTKGITVQKQKRKSKKPPVASLNREATSILQKIQALYERIPIFPCIKGCTDCCGVVPFAQAEWENIPDKRYAILSAPDALTCPYSKEGTCAIYSDRPLLCRLFGTSQAPLLQCPHGRKPETLLTEDETKALIREYTKLQGQISGPHFRIYIT